MGHLIDVPGSSGDLVLSAGQQGDIAYWHRSKDHLGPAVTIGQVESWAWSDSGTLYAGTYPHARLVEVTRDQLAGHGEPRILADLRDSHLQSRPIAVCPTPEALYGGTTPGYGLRDGAMTRVDLDTGEIIVAKMTDETVHAIAQHGDGLLVGTSPEAGTGAPERPGQGRLLRVDPKTLAVLAERPAPGNARTVGAIGTALGQWWVVADSGLWHLDPDSLEVDRVVELAGSSGRRAQLLTHRDRLVIRIDGDVWLVDPDHQKTEQLSYGCWSIAVVGDQVCAVVQPEGGTTNTDLRWFDISA